MKLRAIDLFSGCGGFSLGMEKAGIKVSHAIDMWDKIKETFEYNHPETEFILSDITKLDPEDFKQYKFDIVFGSPPCQQFSQANANPNPNLGMELVNTFLEWVEVIQPKFWIMENVPQTVKWIKWRVKSFKIPIFKILNSANFGVAQERKRMFAGRYIIPERTHVKNGPSTNLFGKRLEKWISVQDAIKDIIFIKPNQLKEEEINSLYPGGYETKGKFFENPGVLDPKKPARIVTTKKDFALIPNHNCLSLNQEKCKKWIEQGWQGFKVLNDPERYDKPAMTITDNHGNSNIIRLDSELRRLTVREVARFQSFPDEFIFHGKLTNQYKMIGNAVPPRIAQKLGEAIMKKIQI